MCWSGRYGVRVALTLRCPLRPPYGLPRAGGVRPSLIGLSLGLHTGLRAVDGTLAKPLLCFPKRVQVGQVIDIICNYLQANPATRHQDGADLAGAAIMSAFFAAGSSDGEVVRAMLRVIAVRSGSWWASLAPP